MMFLADESCDFIVVRALRAVGYDILAVTEFSPGATDEEVLDLCLNEQRILLTEDRDFGEWIFAHGTSVKGVLLIRYPSNARRRLPGEVITLLDEHLSDLSGSFVVLEPGRARIRGIP
jgi:predicted nuclease of predicted toxin-antitoxin system